jgi:hypothetical protein
METQFEMLERRLEQSERRGERTEHRLEEAERGLAQAHRQLESSERRGEQTRQRFRAMCGLAVAIAVAAVLLEVRAPAAAEQSGGLPALAARVAVVETKLAPVSIVPGYRLEACPEVVFSGVNVRIVNGLGSTETVNGCGNLIVGYNELRTPEQGHGHNLRSGSHNVIVGGHNNYSSYGGVVVGAYNDISGAFSSVSGGTSNRASGDFSSVGGGVSNWAGGAYSWVGGGTINSASGEGSAVTGGAQNTAGGDGSSVSGGADITQGTLFGWSGGSKGDVVSGRFRSP